MKTDYKNLSIVISKGSYILVSGRKIPPMRDDLTRESGDFNLSFCKNLSSRIHSGRSLQDDKSKESDNITMSFCKNLSIVIPVKTGIQKKQKP